MRSSVGDPASERTLANPSGEPRKGKQCPSYIRKGNEQAKCVASMWKNTIPRRDMFARWTRAREMGQSGTTTFVFNLRIEGGQRPGYGTKLISVAGCLAGVVPKGELWGGPLWSAFRSRLRGSPHIIREVARPVERPREGQAPGLTPASASECAKDVSRSMPVEPAGAGASGATASSGHGCFVECTSAYPAWPPAVVYYDEHIEPAMLRALQGVDTVYAKLFSLDHSKYGDALRRIRENHPKGRVRILLDTSNFENPKCSQQTPLIRSLLEWGVEFKHWKPTAHAFSYNHEKAWLFGKSLHVSLYAFGSASATHNSTTRCGRTVDSCGFLTISSIVEEAAARFDEGWSEAHPIGFDAVEDVERCRERRRSKSCSRARSQSALDDVPGEPEDGGGASVPVHYRIGSVPPSLSCPEVGSAGQPQSGPATSRWRGISRSGSLEAPPLSQLSKGPRRSGPAPVRAAAALGAPSETEWKDARSRGRGSACSQEG